MSDNATPLGTGLVADRSQTATGATSTTAQIVGAQSNAIVVSTTSRGGVVMRGERGRILPGSQLSKGVDHRSQLNLPKRVRDLVDFDKAIETLVEIAWGKLAPLAKTADRIKAIELLFDRGHGKAPQVIDMNDGRNGGATSNTFKQMPTEKLIATVEAMRALAAGTKE